MRTLLNYQHSCIHKNFRRLAVRYRHHCRAANGLFKLVSIKICPIYALGVAIDGVQIRKKKTLHESFVCGSSWSFGCTGFYPTPSLAAKVAFSPLALSLRVRSVSV